MLVNAVGLRCAFYTNQSNFILPDHHLEFGNEAKRHVIET